MTIQHGDTIDWNGGKYYTHTPILESCPTDHPLVKRISFEEAMRMGWDFSTAYVRGYHASWIVLDGFIYLKDVSGIFKKCIYSLVHANWFNGGIVIGGGNSLDLVNPITRILYIEAGRVINSISSVGEV